MADSFAHPLGDYGVVFDLDGLLLDTERRYFESFSAAACVFNVPFSRDCFIDLIGRPHAHTNALLLQQYGDDFPLDDFEAEWRGQFAKIVAAGLIAPMPGAVALLEFLDEKNIPRSIATSSHRELVEQTTTAAGIRSYFDQIVCGDEVEHGKPAPDIYLAACQLLGLAPSQCLAFEDTDVGLSAAVAAGLRAMLVPDMKPSTAESVDQADRVFTSLIEAKDWLQAR